MLFLIAAVVKAYQSWEAAVALKKTQQDHIIKVAIQSAMITHHMSSLQSLHYIMFSNLVLY